MDISALLRDAPTRHHDETAVLLGDPFLAEIARYTAHLDETQKSIFLNHVRELAQGRRASWLDPNLRRAALVSPARAAPPLGLGRSVLSCLEYSD